MNLDKYLKINGLKKDFFAKKLGVTRTTLYRYMTGNKKIPIYIKLAIENLTNGEVNEINSGRRANSVAKSKKSKKYVLRSSISSKKNVAWIIKEQLKKMENFELIKQPISIKLQFQMPIPKSISKKKYNAMINQPHTKNKDIDNLCKFIFDALNGVVWEDDRLIWKLESKKIYSETPQTICDIEYAS